MAHDDRRDEREEGARLLASGWIYDPGAGVYRWRDPINRLSWYRLKDALELQRERDARG